MTARKMKGHWWVDFRYQRQRVRKRSPVDTKRGAQAYERLLRQRLLQGLDLDGRTEEQANKEIPTLKEFAREFMSTWVVPNNKPSTISDKRMILSRHLLPHFGRMRLDAIGIRDVERFKARQLKKGLSPKTVNNHLTVLRKALVCAWEWEIISGIPRIKWLKTADPTFDFFTQQESDRLLAGTEGTANAMIATALKAGLRRGELLALRWQDVDLRASNINVRRSVWKGHVGTPKGGRSREVAISPGLRAVLAGHRHLRGESVFCNEDGSMLSAGQVRRFVPDGCKAAGLRRAQWHVLRHSFASQLVMAGVPLKVVQELLGHSTIDMTMRYAHLAPSIKVDAVARLDGPVGGGEIATCGGHHLGTTA